VEAAFGRPPRADGEVTFLPPLPNGMSAVVAFVAHHVVAADIDDTVARSRLSPGDVGAPMSPAFLLFLAGWVGAEPGMLDVVLAATDPTPIEPSGLWIRDDLGDHPRVQRALRFRPQATVYADRPSGEPDGVLVVGEGVAGRWEMAFEVAPHARGNGIGRRFAAAATALVPHGEPLFAQVTPGNVASLRAFLAAGYVPVGAEVLFAP